MDYKKEYEEALERARKINNGEEVIAPPDYTICEVIFPILKESEDEKIRKGIIRCIKGNMPDNDFRKKYIAWLEKQGEYANFRNKIQIGDKVTRNENGVLVNLSQLNRIAEPVEKQGKQKFTDKVEPKFKVGDFIINEYGFIMQIDGIDGNMYVYHVLDDNRILRHDITKTEKSCHHWTIKDAKDGDVLVCKGKISSNKNGQEIGIVKNYVGIIGGCDNCFETYCFIDWDGNFRVSEAMGSPNIHPATKEQCELLFTKMKEAGYEWDAEKKELKKIEQKTAWSEEDEKMYTATIFALSGFMGNEDKLNWLKAIKERYTWKPSKEQMEALQCFLEHGCAAPDREASIAEKVLETLYSDLKQLIEE